jgi:hypothetical protein
MENKELLEELKQFVSYAEREGVLNSHKADELRKFAETYIEYIK